MALNFARICPNAFSRHNNEERPKKGRIACEDVTKIDSWRLGKDDLNALLHPKWTFQTLGSSNSLNGEQ
jgi:hypothetical protein